MTFSLDGSPYTIEATGQHMVEWRRDDSQSPG